LLLQQIDPCTAMPPKKRARTAAAAAEPAVVVCYGDSNTHGANSEGDTRLPLASRWTTHLASALGSEVLVVPEGLNGRTTVIDDPQENPDFAGIGGEGMNGRRFLLPCLHSHKPVSVVVLALGCNVRQAASAEPWPWPLCKSPRSCAATLCC
jgi:lysophospholipase L1-like esterase